MLGGGGGGDTLAALHGGNCGAMLLGMCVRTCVCLCACACVCASVCAHFTFQLCIDAYVDITMVNRVKRFQRTTVDHLISPTGVVLAWSDVWLSLLLTSLEACTQRQHVCDINTSHLHLKAIIMLEGSQVGFSSNTTLPMKWRQLAETTNGRATQGGCASGEDPAQQGVIASLIGTAPWSKSSISVNLTGPCGCCLDSWCLRLDASCTKYVAKKSTMDLEISMGGVHFVDNSRTFAWLS